MKQNMLCINDLNGLSVIMRVRLAFGCDAIVTLWRQKFKLCRIDVK